MIFLKILLIMLHYLHIKTKENRKITIKLISGVNKILTVHKESLIELYNKIEEKSDDKNRRT